MAKRLITILTFTLFLFSDLLYLAQKDKKTVKYDFKPSSINQPGLEFPQVNSEGRVHIRISAPEATLVQLDIGGVKYDLVNDENGLWKGESEPLDEGFHYYQLWIDGAAVPDTGSMHFYGAGRWGSGVEVPAPDKDFCILRNVPHGQILENLYFSKITGKWRRCFIYIPPDYETNITIRYPVLFLPHGSFEDETGWSVQGKANLILDNLIARKNAVPMIIVMDNGYTLKSTQSHEAPARVSKGFSAFEEVLIRVIIPMIDSTYRTNSDREHRAMANLLMGANQTIHITMNNLDVFSYIGGFSGTSNYASSG
jgi:hypothetical protein